MWFTAPAPTARFICCTGAARVALCHKLSSLPLQVDLVLLPATTGDFGVMPGHVPTVAQLRPGVVTIHSEMDKEIEKYFVSAGAAHAVVQLNTNMVMTYSSSRQCLLARASDTTLTPDPHSDGLKLSCAGFAFINADSTTDVCAVEAVKLEDLDPEAVRAGLSEYQAKLGSLQVSCAHHRSRCEPACLQSSLFMILRLLGYPAMLVFHQALAQMNVFCATCAGQGR